MHSKPTWHATWCHGGEHLRKPPKFLYLLSFTPLSLFSSPSPISLRAPCSTRRSRRAPCAAPRCRRLARAPHPCRPPCPGMGRSASSTEGAGTDWSTRQHKRSLHLVGNPLEFRNHSNKSYNTCCRLAEYYKSQLWSDRESSA